MTNGERLRERLKEVSDEELADFLAHFQSRCCAQVGFKSSEKQFYIEWLKWTTEEYKDE